MLLDHKGGEESASMRECVSLLLFPLGFSSLLLAWRLGDSIHSLVISGAGLLAETLQIPTVIGALLSLCD